MPVELTVRGANELAAITARLKAAGNGGLRRELLREIRNGAKPLIPAVKRSAANHLPSGYNDEVTTEKFVIRTRTSGRNPGVRVQSLSTRDLKALDQGVLRHPVYPKGDRASWHWVTQQIPAGFWTDEMKRRVPAVRRNISRALRNVARRL